MRTTTFWIPVHNTRVFSLKFHTISNRRGLSILDIPDSSLPAAAYRSVGGSYIPTCCLATNFWICRTPNSIGRSVWTFWSTATHEARARTISTMVKWRRNRRRLRTRSCKGIRLQIRNDQILMKCGSTFFTFLFHRHVSYTIFEVVLEYSRNSRKCWNFDLESWKSRYFASISIHFPSA